jgi:hypothetical protein
MAAIRTVLIDKFSTYGNPFVSLATSISSIFSSAPQVEETLSKTDASTGIVTERPPIHNNRKLMPIKSSVLMSKQHTIITSLKRLVSGKGDFGPDNKHFVVITV